MFYLWLDFVRTDTFLRFSRRIFRFRLYFSSCIVGGPEAVGGSVVSNLTCGISDVFVVGCDGIRWTTRKETSGLGLLDC